MSEKLINLVKSHNVLYDKKAKNYKDLTLRSAAWEDVAENMKEPVDKVKDDWTKLRNSYTNALKRRNNKKTEEAAMELLPWKFEEQMSFLLPHIKFSSKPRNIVKSPSTCADWHYSDNMNETQSDSEPETPSYGHGSGMVSHDTGDPLVWEPTPYAQTKHKLHELYDLMDNPEKRPKTQNIQDMDETDLFFLSMSKAIKTLPKIDQTKIKLDLHTAISKAEIRQIEKKEPSDTYE